MRSLVRVQARPQPSLSHFFKIITKTFKDIFFPIYCLQCGSVGYYICSNCLQPVEWYGNSIPIWDKNPKLHDTLTSLQAVAPHRSVIGQLVRGLKYRGLREIAQVAAELIYFHNSIPEDVSCVTAVPLHAKRLQTRGYNQAALIAQHLATIYGLPYRPLLGRVRHTASQVTTEGKEAREQNLKRAFRVQIEEIQDIAGTNVLLVDDVCTTGSTLIACARELQKNGAKDVHAVTLTHG